jgi:Domain of unknown function (DUF4373)
MANKPKVGFSYFNIESNFFTDVKIRKLIKYQSSEAVAVYLNLLCIIYNEGYYIRWDDELPFVISESTGSKEGFISEVIKCCVQVGLLDRLLFENEKVLTSLGIQKRFQFICNQLKRKKSISEFSLIDSEELAIDSEELAIDSEELLQRKEKERKEKEKREKKIKISLGAPEDFFDFDLEKRKNVFKELLRPYLEIYGKKTLNDFYNYWSATVLESQMMLETKPDFFIVSRLKTWKSIENKNQKIQPQPHQLQQPDDFLMLKSMYENETNC